MGGLKVAGLLGGLLGGLYGIVVGSILAVIALVMVWGCGEAETTTTLSRTDTDVAPEATVAEVVNAQEFLVVITHSGKDEDGALQVELKRGDIEGMTTQELVELGAFISIGRFSGELSIDCLTLKLIPVRFIPAGWVCEEEVEP